MRDEVIDVLLKIGIPAGMRGFTYICDAMEMFDKDPYYENGKICILYYEIAKKHDSTQARVERAIRHAFETATTKGNLDMVERYLTLTNTQNSNLLKTLYIRIKQEQRKNQTAATGTISADGDSDRMTYIKAMDKFSYDMQMALTELNRVTRSLEA